jgi:O-antigen/teichoic acid export membrane protein
MNSNHDLSNLLRSAARLFLGMAGARAISIAAMPIITRLYGPEDFALLALFVAFVSLLNPLAAFGYPGAVPLPKEDVMAINVAALSGI